MSVTAAPVVSDRSDFRTVTVGGAQLGVATAVAVVAWMGGIVTAAGGETILARRVLPAVAATIVVALIVRLSGVAVELPVATGGAFTVVVAALAVLALARKG